MQRGRSRGNVSIVDVARQASVSPATAGRVLGGYGYASAAVADRVREAAAALGYRPNLLARGLITGRTQTIGVVASDIASPFYAAVIRGIADTAQTHGFGILVTSSDENLALEHDAVRLLLAKQVDGLIVAPSTPDSPSHLRTAVASGCPVVQIDRVTQGLAADSVTVDNIATTRNGVRRLIEAGHRRIGFVAELQPGDLDAFLADGAPAPTAFGLMPSWLRLGGYLLACREAGLDIDARLICRVGAYAAYAAKAAVLALLASAHRPTALMTADGMMSIGAMQAIGALGLAIPHDLSLVCFDDLDWMQFLGTGITAACQPTHQLGSTAVDLLLRRLAGQDEPEQHVMLPAPLVERGSIAPPRFADRDGFS